MTRRPINFARALIVASGIAGLGTGCGRVALVEPAIDGGPTVVDAGNTDAGSRTDAGLADAGIACTQCDCNNLDAGLPSCFSVGRSECCFAVGPLPPPDLPALA